MHKLTHSNEGVVDIISMSDGDNRLSPKLLLELDAALEAANSRKQTRAIILTGSGKFFSNGLDLEWMQAHANQPKEIGGYLFQLNRLFHKLTLFPKPTIATLNGHTFAGGFFLAAHCDFRLMRKDRGWISLPEAKIGIPLLPGMIQICQAIMPPQSYRKIVFTADRFNAQEALEMGIIDAVASADELIQESITLATKLAEAKLPTYAEIKRRNKTNIARTLLEEDPKLFASTLAFALE